ncbi:MAG TPA: kelch repeat-containing protein [Myxococcaceae bacterium]
MPHLRHLPCLAAALLLCLAACTSEPTGEPSAQPTGSVQFAATAQQELTANDVTRVKLTISATDMTASIVELAKANGTWGGLIGNIPAGTNRTFLAEAYDTGGTKIFQGSTAGVTITANQTTAVAITLQEILPPPAYGNEAPLIESVIVSSTTVQLGSSITLNATVRDPNAGDTVTVAWTATAGAFATPSATSTTWTAPSSTGIHTLTLTATDSQGLIVALSLTVNVVSSASFGSATHTIAFNSWPVVSKASATRSRLDAGQSTAVTANASDANGDTLSYQWTSTCTGTWTNATSSAASFVPSSIPSGACNNCRLTVTVQDGRGGQNKGEINLCIASAATERFAPTFTNNYQTATAASSGQTVTFNVTAMDYQSSALTFGWLGIGGTFGTAQNTATTSQVVWTAPSCAVTGVSTYVTAVVTNAFGLSASKPFSLSGLPACPAGWAGAGSLGAARQLHTATLLPSGKVLVAGGIGSGGNLHAEQYDPGLNSWSAAGTMTTARRYHTATLLPSGKVLVTGGNATPGFLNSAEVYDPATNSWSAVSPMTTARQYHTATLLPSGKVLVAGGQGSSGNLLSAELYDPVTNSWSSAGTMTTARYSHTATALSSFNKVLVTGGYGNSGYLRAAEVYDAVTNSWTNVTPMTTVRQHHTATLLPSGKVLVVGGSNSSVLSSTEVYDVSANTWTTSPSVLGARSHHTATLLPSGKLLIAGGIGPTVYNPDTENDETTFHSSVAVYDPTANSWSWGGSMPSTRYLHTAIPLISGRVLIMGGLDNGSYASAALSYTP